MPELTATDAIRVGGWDARYAVVPTLATDGDVAVALIAGNGYGYEMSVEVFRRDGDQWESGGSSGYGTGDAYDLDSGMSEGFVYAVGRSATPNHRAFIRFAGEVAEVATGSGGFWSWIRAVDEPWGLGLPEVVSPPG